MSSLRLDQYSVGLLPKSSSRLRSFSLLPRKNPGVVSCHGDDNARSSAMQVAGGKYNKFLSPSVKEQQADHDHKQTKSTSISNEGIGIIRFLKGKHLFITGATGFLAKVLIEKILRTIPDVGKIYVLIKSKDKEAALHRLKTEIIYTEIFKYLQEIHGKSYESFMLGKLIPVVGDVREARLGIEEELAEEISKEVDLIVNSAANTTFDERYDVALDVNTMGPCRLMNFAKRFKRLKLFVHVSTAYVNGQRQGRVLENPFCMGDSIARERSQLDFPDKFMPCLDIETELKLAFTSGNNIQELKDIGLSRAHMFGWQDTYVLTKAMGEMMINSMRADIPVVIIRPTIIESTSREPFPGWIEGNRMMEPMLISYGKGRLTGFHIDPDGALDVVPADMVSNAMLAAMAKHGQSTDTRTTRTAAVYHIASSTVNPLVNRDLLRFFFQHFTTTPCMDPKGMPIAVKEMKHFTNVDEFSSYVQTEAIERWASLVNSSPSEKSSPRSVLENIFMKSAKQAKRLSDIYGPYIFYGGRFDITNTQKLMEEMSEEEMMSFGFDVGSINWEDYITNVHIPGVRKHVMKERVPE